jgi:F-type H+-transporting ATPase subunit delta
MKDDNASARLRANPTAQRVARVYAEALYDEAQKNNALASVLEELQSLTREVMGTDTVLRSFFSGGVVGRDRREAALSKALKGQVSDVVLNFILVLNKHERLELLQPVIAVYTALLEDRTGKVRVSVQTAAPLPEDQRSRLVSQLRELTKREPLLEEKVDPDLLGGLVVQVGDWRYDASVRHQLEIIRNQLIESSSHEIQTGRDRFSTAEGN